VVGDFSIFFGFFSVCSCGEGFDEETLIGLSVKTIVLSKGNKIVFL
jgi:hypothetical protein